MNTRWTRTAIALLFVAATAWQVAAQAPDEPRGPADLADTPAQTTPRPDVPTLPLRGIGEVGALAPTELQEEYECLNEQAAKTARELRELKTADGWRRPGVAHQLRSVLRSTVAGLFEIRQQLQRRELAEYQARLARIEQQIEEREPLKAIIIDRRVEELINPAVAWPPDISQAMEAGGETAAQVSATLTLAAPKDGDRAATPPAPESEEFAVRGSVHVLIQSPEGATMCWSPRSADGRSLFRAPPGFSSGGARKTLPASFVVAHGQRVPFHLWDMPGRGDLRLYGSLEIAPLSEAIFLASAAIPIEITEENLTRAWSGEEVVKLIWVSAEDGVRVVNYPSLEPGADPVDEARRRGVELRRAHVLAILRLSRQYESIGANEEHGPRMELSPQQPSAAPPRESKNASPEAPALPSNDTSSWPNFRGGPQMTGVAAAPLPDDLSLLWSFRAENGAFEGTAIIADGAAYLGDQSGSMYALDMNSGEKRWEFRLENQGAGFNAASAVHDGLVYIGDTAGKLHCLNTGDGAPVWSYQTGGEINGGANFYRGNVLIGSQDGTLYCLNGKTGELVWKHVVGVQIRSTPAIAGDRCLLAGCDARLHIIALDGGEKLAELMLAGPTGVTPAVRGDLAYFGVENGVFYAVDWQKAEVAWKEGPNGRSIRSSSAVTNELALFGSRDHRLYALDRATGQERWSFLARDDIDSSPVVAGALAYFGSADGRVYGVDLASGDKVWEYEIGGRVLGSPAVAEGKLVIGGEDGVYCFGKKG